MTALHLLVLAALLSLAMGGAWLFESRTGKSGWIDVTWSAAVGAVGVVAALLPVGWRRVGRQVLVAALVAVWSVRLVLHLARRTLKHGVDPRYQALRQRMGRGGAAAHVRLPAEPGGGRLRAGAGRLCRGAQPGALRLRLQDILALRCLPSRLPARRWPTGRCGSFATTRPTGQDHGSGPVGPVAASQLFLRVAGLGGLSAGRIGLPGGYWQGWLALLAPLLMYYLLVKVSGIPPLEKHMAETRGEAFEDYRRRVRAFWPMPRAGRGRAMSYAAAYTGPMRRMTDGWCAPATTSR